MRLSSWFSPFADSLTLSSFVEAIFPRYSGDGCLAKDFDPLKRRLPFDRHMLVTGCGLDQMAASGEQKVVAGHEHAVSGGAVEQILARGNGRLDVKIESRSCVGRHLFRLERDDVRWPRRHLAACTMRPIPGNAPHFELHVRLASYLGCQIGAVSSQSFRQPPFPWLVSLLLCRMPSTLSGRVWLSSVLCV